MPATVARAVFSNEFIAPFGEQSLEHRRWIIMTRLSIVLGPLIEVLKGEVDLDALKNDCL